MRFIELVDGFFQLPITEEEDNLVAKFGDDSIILKDNLNEREREIARLLTSKGIFSRIKKENKLYYKLNILTEEK